MNCKRAVSAYIACFHKELCIATTAMAEHLASIFGTERDKVNCPFYFKIGACRHGDRCSRMHNKPLFSQTIMFENMYRSIDQIRNAAAAQGLPPPAVPEGDEQYHFEDFYEDVWEEMSKYGEVEEIHICENLSDHLAGNTYVKFRDEDGAQNALKNARGRWYAGRPVKVEYSPVTDFRESRCRPFERRECDRGDYCNFMHIRRLPDDLYYRTHGGGDHQRRRSYGRSFDDFRGISDGRDDRRRFSRPRRRSYGREDKLAQERMNGNGAYEDREPDRKRRRDETT